MRVPSAPDSSTKTDTGRRRTNNEDAAGSFEPGKDALRAERGCVYVVADGMGGHNAGEVAAHYAVRSIIYHYYTLPWQGQERTLTQAILEANAGIHAEGIAAGEKQGMGCTVVAAAIVSDQVVIVNAGDSRAYLLHDDILRQVSLDHSWVAEQVAAGALTPAQAATHPGRNMLTRNLGFDPEVEPSIARMALGDRDRLLLCTDGLWGALDDRTIQDLAGRGDATHAVSRLIDEANAHGGPDNIGVAVIDFGGARRAPARDDVTQLVAPTWDMAVLTAIPQPLPVGDHARVWAVIVAAVVAVLAAVVFLVFLVRDSGKATLKPAAQTAASPTVRATVVTERTPAPTTRIAPATRGAQGLLPSTAVAQESSGTPAAATAASGASAPTGVAGGVGGSTPAATTATGGTATGGLTGGGLTGGGTTGTSSGGLSTGGGTTATTGTTGGGLSTGRAGTAGPRGGGISTGGASAPGGGISSSGITGPVGGGLNTGGVTPGPGGGLSGGVPIPGDAISPRIRYTWQTGDTYESLWRSCYTNLLASAAELQKAVAAINLDGASAETPRVGQVIVLPGGWAGPNCPLRAIPLANQERRQPTRLIV